MVYREIIAVCSEIHTKYINTLCGQNVEIVDAGKITKSDYKLCHDCLSVCTPTGWIFMKFDITIFSDHLSEKFKLHYDRTRMTVLQLTTHVHLGWRLAEFLRCEIFQTKIVDNLITHLTLNNLYLWESRRLRDKTENWYSQTGYKSQCNMAYPLYILDN
jgi:hypothetical protein